MKYLDTTFVDDELVDVPASESAILPVQVATTAATQPDSAVSVETTHCGYDELPTRVQLSITGTTTHSGYKYQLLVQLPIPGKTTHSGNNYKLLVQLPIPGTTTHFGHNHPF
jgi:non-ribosomal peptide synthetase component F